MSAITSNRASARGLLAVLVLLVLLNTLLPAADTQNAPASALTHWQLPLSQWAGNAIQWIARDAALGDIHVQDITRGLATLVDAPIKGLDILLASGWSEGSGFNKHLVAPPLSWAGLALAATLLGWSVGGKRLAALMLIGCAYLVSFNLWQSTMTTLANVFLCVLVAAAAGLVLGIVSYRNERMEQWTAWVMNIMQTVPIFAYLLPTLLLFGYGPSAALLATVLYALPPMVHATVLALRSVPEEIREYGHMAGATRHQLLWKVEIPTALPMLTVGLNQVVMMCLNMVIIASMIGAGGLGYDVLRALRRLDMGAGLQAGMAIVVLAVMLDRLTQAIAQRQSGGRSHHQTRIPLWVYPLLISITTLLSLWLPALHSWPVRWVLTTASFWNDAVSYINQHWFDQMEALRTFTLLNLMNPLRDGLQALGFPVVATALGAIGWYLAGWRVAVPVVLMTVFVAVSGYWAAAMASVYLTLCAVLVSVLIGFPLGVWIASRPRLHAAAALWLDTLQTLPTFVYLLPAVMLFRNGDFSALIAITSYSIAPVVRYTIHGLRSVPESRIEAATMAGCTQWQTFRHVRLPAAFPTLLLGLNQTIMMAISMLVIAALVGTRDLGQEVYIALTQANTGAGIVAGLGIAAIALIADTLLKAWAARQPTAQA